MHQSVVEYEIVPAAMTAVATAPATSGAAPVKRGEAASLGSYLIAAAIAAGLVATWMGLCII